MHKFRVIIPAAGRGERMMSDIPKALHRICGKTVIERCVETAENCGFEKPVVVVGFEGDKIKEHIGGRAEYAVCHQLCGAAYACLAAESCFDDYDGDVLVVYGNLPAVTVQTVTEAFELHKNSGAAATVIVKKKDEDDIFTDCGAAFFSSKTLFGVLKELCKTENGGKIGIGDVALRIKRDGGGVSVSFPRCDTELCGVYDRFSFAEITAFINSVNVKRVMSGGVTVVDPSNTYIGDDVTIGRDTVIEPGCFIYGKTEIGPRCVIGPQTRLTDMKIGSGVSVINSVCVESTAADGAHIGPFSYIRPNSEIGKNVKIGDFVEIKNSSVGEGTKVSHLTYVGDSDVGANVNFGCGTVTVNYDGNHKYRTKIGDNAFIGCNTNLVAPVEVAENAFTAAGSTITERVPADSLAIARAKQVNKHGWVTGRKEKNK